jgi:hypothetical protein
MPTENTALNSTREGLLGPLSTLVLAFGLTWWFFPVLWLGGGLVGGDLYPYFMPQKTAYADALAEGRIPLWNHLVGHGYPQLAESQTGVLYPPHLAAYALLDVNSAYVTVQLAHYVIAFCGMSTLSRGLGLGRLAAWLAAVVFVYGWFPPRLCLEWAIIGGAWFPWAIQGVERWWKTGLWRYAFLAWAALALQLLAGHFVIAFITLITVVVWSAFRWTAMHRAAARSQTTNNGVPVSTDSTSVTSRPLVVTSRALGIALIIVGAFLAAAVQLVPTWEFKRTSQRQAGHVDFDPGYGAIPWPYLAQIVTPWSSYTDPGDINNLRAGQASLTNRVEAHLYFGLLPLALFAIGCGRKLSALGGRKDNFHEQRAASTPPATANPDDDFLERFWWPLVAVAALATFHATGLAGPVTSRLPGFGYFTGPGRFGLLTTFIVALLASHAGDLLWRHRASIPARPATLSPRALLATLAGFAILLGTVLDFEWVAARVGYAVQVLRPPIEFRDRSPLREQLGNVPGPPRLFCRGANVATLLDVAATPTYLGLSPAAYTNPALRMPEPLPFDTPPTAAQIAWLQQAGVTHVLSFSELDTTLWPVKPAGLYDDPLLNLAWGRYGGTDQPLFFLYELTGSRGRVAWTEPHPDSSARVERYTPEQIEIEAVAAQPGRLVLTDLAYPGWNVTVDGQPAATVTVDGMYRGVDVPAGSHRIVWSYAPLSFRLGAGISLATLFLAAALGHVRFWHPGWIEAAGEWLRNRRRTAGPAQ